VPNLISNDKLLFTMWSLQGDQQILNTHILNYVEGLAGPEDYQLYAAAYLADCVALGGLPDTLAPYLSDQYTIQRVSLQKVYPTRLAAIFDTAASGGQVSEVAAPVNSSLTVTKRTISATRYGIGSWHQAGVPISKIMAGGATWVNTTVAGIELALDNWFLPSRVPTGKSGQVEAILWNRSTPLRITHVYGYEGQTSIRTMHRRTKGVGI